jgi:hypothetical protein
LSVFFSQEDCHDASAYASAEWVGASQNIDQARISCYA